MLLRRGSAPALGSSRPPCRELRTCPPARLKRRAPPHGSGGRAARAAAARVVAAAAPAASEPQARRGRPGRKKAPEEDSLERGQPPLPTPLDYQQTLLKSFTVGGVGLHTGEYAYVRVRPAFAGEGRYFVRVPPGTNSGRFLFDAGSMEETPEEEMLLEQPVDEDLEDQKVEWFSLFLEAQEQRGFPGNFGEFTQLQVDLGELDAELRRRMLGLGEDEPEPDPAVEPDLSNVAEEVVPLDPKDSSVIMAAITSVLRADLPCTQLGIDDDHKVMSVELLLAALEACGVDNARIEIEGGPEVPVLDNSSLGWAIEIQCAGLRPAPLRGEDDRPVQDEDEEVMGVLQRDVIMPSNSIAVQDEQGWIAFFPGPFTKLTAGVDHTDAAPIIGCQWATWRYDDAHFRYALAPARAYVESIEQLHAWREAGYVQAGAENLFNIAVGDGWWDPEVVRMAYDEPSRYRLAQLVGNLSLLNIAGCQGIPVGHVTSFNASPSLQLTFVRSLMENIQEADVVPTASVFALQDAWWDSARRASPLGRAFTSAGPMPGMGDGSPAELPGHRVRGGPDEGEAASAVEAEWETFGEGDDEAEYEDEMATEDEQADEDEGEESPPRGRRR